MKKQVDNIQNGRKPARRLCLRRTLIIGTLAALVLASVIFAVLICSNPRYTGTPKDLVIKLETDKNVVHVNDIITIWLLAFNPTTEAINIYFSNADHFSGIIEVTNGSNNTVIYNSTELYYIEVVENETIPPYCSCYIATTETMMMYKGTFQIRAIGNVAGYPELAIDCTKEIIVN